MARRLGEEDRLQIDCAGLLRRFLRKTVWFHVPNGKKRDPITAGILRQMGVRPGVADFIMLSDGRAYAFELKTGKGRQSDNQEGFQAVWEAQGGVYEIFRSVEELQGLLFKYAMT